jgi:tetratricopeptide (TPR) repeat protein
MITDFTRTKTASLTCILFIFMMISNAYLIRADDKVDLSSLCRQGEALYEADQFEAALEVFKKAISLGGDSSPEMNQLYLDISRTYFRLNNREKSEEYLRKIFDGVREADIDERQFEDDYRMMFKKIAAEYWFSMKSVNRVDKQEDRRIIAKMSEKPEKKRKKLLSILLVGGVLVASALGLVLLLGKNNQDNMGGKGALKVINRSEFNIMVYVGTMQRFITPYNSVMIYLEAGTYTVEIRTSSVLYSYQVVIRSNETSVLTFSAS